MNPIRISPAACSGCRACEAACVLHHESSLGTAASRIHIEKIEEDGIDLPHICRLCPDPACVKACKTGALHKDSLSGIIRVSDDMCTGCMECRFVCPHGAVFFHPTRCKPLICDLCNGSPACVLRCSTGAITWEE